jgi:hypothetical protein
MSQAPGPRTNRKTRFSGTTNTSKTRFSGSRKDPPLGQTHKIYRSQQNRQNPPTAALSRSSKRTRNAPGFRPESRPSALLGNNRLSAFGKGTTLPREVSDYETVLPRMQPPFPSVNPASLTGTGRSGSTLHASSACGPQDRMTRLRGLCQLRLSTGPSGAEDGRAIGDKEVDQRLRKCRCADSIRKSDTK